MKERSIAALAVFLGSAVFISQPLKVRATEGHFFDNRGMPSEQPDRWKSLASTGSEMLESKRYDVAIRFLTGALNVGTKSEGESAYLHGLRGDAYLEKGEPGKALADYARAVNFVPKSSADYLTRGGAYEKIGNYKAAASDYASGIALSPDDATAINALAWLRATCPEALLRDGREAIRAGTKACELTRWKDSYVIDTLAAAYAEVGNFDQAAKLQQQALQLRSPSRDDRKGMQERLSSYQRRKPYRQPSKAPRAARKSSELRRHQGSDSYVSTRSPSQRAHRV